MQSSELFLALAVQCLFISAVVCKKIPNVKAIIKSRSSFFFSITLWTLENVIFYWYETCVCKRALNTFLVL